LERAACALDTELFNLKLLAGVLSKNEPFRVAAFRFSVPFAFGVLIESFLLAF